MYGLLGNDYLNIWNLKVQNKKLKYWENFI